MGRDLLPLELADIAQDLSPFGFETISEDEFGEEFTLDSGEKKPYQQISLTLHDKQAELILACIDYVHAHGEVKETSAMKTTRETESMRWCVNGQSKRN